MAQTRAESQVGPSRTGGVTERGWWQATQHQWTHPAEWTIWNLVLIASLVLLLGLSAYWFTRPGNLLGGTETLNAGVLYSDPTAGRYVYEMLDEPSDGRRMQATLQSLYDAHKGAASNGQLTIVLIRRATPITAFITGGPIDESGVLGRVVVGSQRQAHLRRNADAPLEPVTLRW